MKGYTLLAALMMLVATLNVQATEPTITVDSANYGTKLGTPAGSTKNCAGAQPDTKDFTSAVGNACNGSSDCTYTVPFPSQADDPYVGCYKNFQVKYHCGSDTSTARTIDIGGVVNEAATQSVKLFCQSEPGINVLAATYGATTQSVGGAVCNKIATGNATQEVSNLCNGRSDCSYAISVSALGDPSPNCKKNFVVTYTCGTDQTQKNVTVPGEANGQTANLSCPSSTPTETGVYVTLDQVTVNRDESTANAWVTYDIVTKNFAPPIQSITLYYRPQVTPETNWRGVVQTDLTARNMDFSNVLTPDTNYEAYVRVRYTKDAKLDSKKINFYTY